MSDLISRQAAIRWVKTECNPYGKPTLDFESGKKVIEHLEQMPSAEPERKGKWIEMGTNKDGTHSIRCSKCGGGYKTRGHARSIATKAKYKFCPNCGADMRGEQDG